MIPFISLGIGCLILGYMIGRLMLVTYSFKNMHTWVDAITKDQDSYDAHMNYISEVRASRIKVKKLMQEVEDHLKEIIENKCLLLNQIALIRVSGTSKAGSNIDNL